MGKEGALSCSNRLKKELLFFPANQPMRIQGTFFKAVQSGLIWKTRISLCNYPVKGKRMVNILGKDPREGLRNGTGTGVRLECCVQSVLFNTRQLLDATTRYSMLRAYEPTSLRLHTTGFILQEKINDAVACW